MPPLFQHCRSLCSHQHEVFVLMKKLLVYQLFLCIQAFTLLFKIERFELECIF